MKKTYHILFFLFILNTGFGQEDFIKMANTFLTTNVKEGLVNYEAIKKNPQPLFQLLDLLATEEIPDTNEKAYLINAYNIFVISGIIENYPISSPMDVSLFFDDDNYILNKKLISLNTLEKEKLLKKYKDPGLHFVLVCGAIGCPQIIPNAYFPNLLENQIKDQVTMTLNSDFLKVDHTNKVVFLSEIFKWYASDFGGNNSSVLAYINQYKVEKIPSNYKIQYYNYNWTLNDVKNSDVETTMPTPTISLPMPGEIIDINTKDTVHKVAPCVADSQIKLAPASNQAYNAGSLLKKGQSDFTLFNTLYTENKKGWKGEDFSGFRTTFVTHLMQWTYGVSKSNNFNIGLDLSFRYSGTSTDSTFKGIGEAFQFKNTPTSRVSFTSAGIRVRWQPFISEKKFSIQSSFTVPTAKFPEGNSDGSPKLHWADWDRLTWWNQFFYTKSFGDFQLFTEIDLLFRFKKYKNQIGMLDIPLNLFFSYFPTSKITLYAMSQHVPRLTNDVKPFQSDDWVIPSDYSASGLGAKYQITHELNIELLYTNFWRGNNSGLGSTFNVGLKYITR